MKEAETKDRSHGSCSGTMRVFIVEARSSFDRPQTHHGMTLDNRWQRVIFAKVPPGFGVSNRLWSAEAESHDFLSHEAALVLAHWFMGHDPSDTGGGYCVETRLVEIEFAHSYSTKEIGVGPSMSMLTMRRAFKSAARDEAEPVTK